MGVWPPRHHARSAYISRHMRGVITIILPSGRTIWIKIAIAIHHSLKEVQRVGACVLHQRTARAPQILSFHVPILKHDRHSK